MKRGLTVTIGVQWDDWVGWRIQASNGAFCGVADVDADEDAGKAWADAIRGFPVGTTDSRLIELGSPGGGLAGGYAQLRFHCIDAAGHAEVEVVLTSGQTLSYGMAQNVKLTIPITAASVDKFVCELQAVSLHGNRTARMYYGAS